MWFCRLANSLQVVGPLSDEQLRAMAREGRLRPTDTVAHDKNGPWYPAAQVRGLFPPVQAQPPSGQVRGQLSAAAPAGSPEGPPKSGHAVPPVLLADPEFLAKQRAQRRKQARRFTLTLIWSGVVVVIVFLLVLMRPLISSMLKVTTQRRMGGSPSREVVQSSKNALTSEVALNVPGLDEVLGHPSTQTQSTSSSASQPKQESRVARLTRLIAASQAFGAATQKMRDSHGHVEISIEDCRIAPVSLRQKGLVYQTTKPYFTIKLRVRNTSPTDTLNYRSPCEGTESAEIWWEKAAQPSSPWQRTGFTLEGQTGDSSIGPGEDLADALAFPPPPEDASLIYVRIPGRSVSVNEDFLFIIAKETIQRLDGSKPSATSENADDASIGPMSPMRRNEVDDSPPEKPKEGNLDEEGVPIPGIHDVSPSPPDGNEMDQEEQAKLEELRRRGEAMQDVLDRQRDNRRPGISRPQNPRR